MHGTKNMKYFNNSDMLASKMMHDPGSIPGILNNFSPLS